MSDSNTTLEQVVEPSARLDNVRIRIYENDVPSFVDTVMEQLYENLYASMIHLDADGRAEDLNTYVATENGEIVAILLFRMENRRAVVLNNVIHIGQAEVARFVRCVFERFKSIKVISFQAIQTDVRKLAYPHQRFNSSEDIVLTLPRSAEDYLASLGKNTRKNVKYYLSRVKRRFPTFEYRLVEREHIAEAQVREILRLKSGRLADRKMSSAIDSRDTDRIIGLAKARGLVGIVTIDGRVCAGSIGYRIGSNSFGGVLAHDLDYDGYWIGMLCCYLTICECIARGYKEYHFLWGRDEYKYRLLGRQRDLDDLTVYRSRMQLLLNAGTACRAACKGYTRLAKRWLIEARSGNGLFAKLLARLMQLRLRAG